MRWLRFLAYQRSVIGLAAAVFFGTLLVLKLDASNRVALRTSVYAGLLVLLMLAVYLTFRYIGERRAILQHAKGNDVPLSMEADYYQELLQRKERQAIRMTNELRRQQYETRDFMISWFHEIKTPISVLRLMQQTEYDPRLAADELDKIEYYAEQALYYAKLESFTEDYDIRPVRVDKLVSERLKSHSRMFISKRIRVEFRPEPFTVLSDNVWLRFIVEQLITNSLKYTNEGGTIAIRFVETKQDKQLIVRDDGIGIPPDEVERVFQRGFTGTNGRRYAKSTGMGLYLAQRMAERLGHAVSCRSELGRHTEMTVRFPKSDSAYFELLRRE